MLDIHPPEHAAHTWRDFFIHIATIVVGLLIAIGLEQSVEALHHRHVLAETRENLHEELKRESESIQSNLDVMQAEEKELAMDAEILRGGAPPTAKLTYRWGFNAPHSIAWITARNNNTTALMNPEEVERYSYLFFLREHVTDISVPYINNVNTAKAIAARSPNAAGLTSLEREQLLQLTGQCQGYLTSMIEMDTFAFKTISEDLRILPK
jgi:hypothetical protein